MKSLLLFFRLRIAMYCQAKHLKAHLAISTNLFWFGLLSWFLPYDGALDAADGLSLVSDRDAHRGYLVRGYQNCDMAAA
jgi:hypothetical protein